jgi:hypothetical protein
MREIGHVDLLQIQRSSLKIGKRPNAYYDPTSLLEVPCLLLTPTGVIGITEDGTHIIDVHNTLHTDTHNKGDNGISIGFTSHYLETSQKFGDHITLGIAGENIIIRTDRHIRLEDLGNEIIFQNPVNEEIFHLEVIRVAAPCVEYAQFCVKKPLSSQEMENTLQFLHNGQRGFLIKIKNNHPSVSLKAGYIVFV